MRDSKSDDAAFVRSLKTWALLVFSMTIAAWLLAFVPFLALVTFRAPDPSGFVGPLLLATGIAFLTGIGTAILAPFYVWFVPFLLKPRFPFFTGWFWVFVGVPCVILALLAVTLLLGFHAGAAVAVLSPGITILGSLIFIALSRKAGIFETPAAEAEA